MKKICIVLFILVMATTTFFAQDVVGNLSKVILDEYKNCNEMTIVTMPPIKINVALIEELSITDNVLKVVVKDDGKGNSGTVHQDISGIARVRLLRKDDAKKGTTYIKMNIALGAK